MGVLRIQAVPRSPSSTKAEHLRTSIRPHRRALYNAAAETFFAALKIGDVPTGRLRPAQARARFAVAEYIEVFTSASDHTPRWATEPRSRPSPTTEERHRLLDQQPEERGHGLRLASRHALTNCPTSRH